jgi:membrane protease YdiL (CAAX protease family)
MLLVSNTLNLSNLIQFPAQYQSLEILILIILQNLCLLIPFGVFYLKNKLTLSEIGFRKTNPLRAFGYIALGYIIFLAININIKLVQVFFKIEIPGFGEQVNKIDLFGTGTFNLAITFFTLAILAPIVEEVFFRGFIQEQLQKITSSKAAIFVQALIFSLAHLEFKVIIPLTIIGAIMGYIYHKTNSIYPTIIFHSINNSLAFLVLLYLN